MKAIKKGLPGQSFLLLNGREEGAVAAGVVTGLWRSVHRVWGLTALENSC